MKFYNREREISKLREIREQAYNDHSLMTQIFQHYHEPLFGRADTILKLSPFSLSVLKEIMNDYHPSYVNDDLLAMYMVTGVFPNMWSFW